MLNKKRRRCASDPHPREHVESLIDDREEIDSHEFTVITPSQQPDDFQAQQNKRLKGLPTRLRPLTSDDETSFTRADLTDLVLNGELQHLLSRLANVLLMLRQELHFCISNPVDHSAAATTTTSFPDEVDGNFFSIVVEFCPCDDGGGGGGEEGVLEENNKSKDRAQIDAATTATTSYSHHKLHAYLDFYRGEQYPCYTRNNLRVGGEGEVEEEDEKQPSLTILLTDGPNTYIAESDDFAIPNGCGYIVKPEPGWCLSDNICVCLNRAFLAQLVDMHTKVSMDRMTSCFDSFSLGKTPDEEEEEDDRWDDDGDISFTKVIEKDNMVVIMDTKVGDMFKYVLEKETPDVIETLSESNMLSTWCNQASHFVSRRSKQPIAYHSITEPEEVHYRQAFKDVNTVELYGSRSQFSCPRAGTLHHDSVSDKYYICALTAVPEVEHCYTPSGLAWAQFWYNSQEKLEKPVNEEWEGRWSHCIKEFLYYTILSYGIHPELFTPEGVVDGLSDNKKKSLTRDIGDIKRMFVRFYEPKGCNWLIQPRYTGMCFSLPHPFYNVPYGITNPSAKLDIPVHHAFITMSPIEEISEECARELASMPPPPSSPPQQHEVDST